MNYTYNCKICGAPLEVDETSTVVTCRYCKRANTISLSGEKSARLLNDANQLRLDGDFEQAKSKYFAIINEYVEEPEAYWGLFLCEYGVSYVDDPINGEKVPTCYKHILKSVYDNTYFKNAVVYARDLNMKALYEKQAREIDEIQYEITHSSQNKYDVFISYKETDDVSKSRTEDSNLAYELYFELEKKGYNVFFARKTLPKGIPYEPVIFSALKSSKVMIVLGTKPQYINAPWVKNEWERYIHQINQGEDKKIIVAYKNMDPYFLPEKLQHLQGINLGEMTALSEIMDFVDKNISKTNFEPQTPNNQKSVHSLLMRAMLFMESKKWGDADNYCEEVLDIEPTNATANLYKLLIQYKVLSIEELAKVSEDIGKTSNYDLAVKFATEKTKESLEVCRKQCVCNLAYSNAIVALNNSEFENAIAILESIKEYSNDKNTISFINKVDDLIQRVDKFIVSNASAVEIENSKRNSKFVTMFFADIVFSVILTIFMYICMFGFGFSEAIDDSIGGSLFGGLLSSLIVLIGPIAVGFVVFVAIFFISIDKNYILDFDNNDKNNVANINQLSVDIKDLISETKEKNDIENAFVKINEVEESFKLLQKDICDKTKKQQKKDARKIRTGIISMLLIALLFVAAFFVTRIIILTDEYDHIISKIDANELESYDEYLEAYNVLKNNPYADSSEEYIKKIENEFPYIGFDSVEVGDVILFGTYEQDGDESSLEPIEWIVARKSGGQITAVSKYILAAMTYEGEDYTWKNSNIRKWLNGDFLNTSFSPLEVNYMVSEDNDLIKLIDRNTSEQMKQLGIGVGAISISALGVECNEYWIDSPRKSDELDDDWLWVIDDDLWYATIYNKYGNYNPCSLDEIYGVRPMIVIDYTYDNQ